jgi:LysR family cys regulon transcriptional activator
MKMKLRQIECFLEVVRCNMSMSAAATALHATQPAISKQLRLLESELRVELFVQRGNRLLELTPAGQEILHAARAVWRESDNIRRIAAEASARRGTVFSVASTFTHARHLLVRPVAEFIARHPEIELRLEQSSPDNICRMVLDGTADIGVVTQPREFPAGLVSVPCAQMKHSLVTPVGHPLSAKRAITLDMLTRYPLIGRDDSQQIGREMRRRFMEAGLEPNVVLRAQDSDVIKAFVEAGVGIAIIPKIAFSPLRDRNLRSRDVSHLFDPTTTHVILRRGVYPSAHMLAFIESLAPQATRRALAARIRAQVDS